MCSIRTLVLPGAESMLITFLASHSDFALKFKYPPTAATSNSPESEEANCSAISAGFCPSCLANGKHGRDKSPCDFSLLTPKAFFQKSPETPISDKADSRDGSIIFLRISIIAPHIIG